MSLQNAVTTVFKADTASYVAAVKNMRGVERDEAKKTLATLEQQNAKLVDQLAVLGKATAAIGAVTIAWKAAQAAANAHLEDLRLEAAAAGADINKLRDATRGLVETDTLLAFAGKAMHGVWKLNQAEMETVAKGTRVLAKDLGIDLQTAMEGVTEAVTKGTTRSLKELGLEVKDETEFLAAMTGAAKRWGQTGTDEGEKWKQATVQMADAWDDLKGALGEMVIALAPVAKMIAELVADIARLASLPGNLGSAETVARVTTGFTGIAEGVSGGAWDQAVAAANGERRLLRSGGGVGVRDLSNMAARVYGAAASLGSRALAETVEEIEKLKKPRAARDLKGYFGMVELEGTVARNDYLAALKAAGFKGGEDTSLGYTLDDALKSEFRSLGGAEDQAALKRFREEMAGIAQAHAELDRQLQGPTVLERIFGKPDEIDKMIIGIEAARAAVDAFGQAGAAAMAAFIEGKSIGDAVKAALAQSLKALAMESTVKALFHLAAAAGNAAFGNWASAGMHIKAAGMYTVVAGAAGVGAKMAHNAGWAGGGGGGGGGAGSALGGGRGGSSGGAGQGGGERTVVVALGRDFNGLTDLEQRQLLNKAIRLGHADNGGTSHVRFR